MPPEWGKPVTEIFLKLYIKLQCLASSDDGQDMMEYGFLVALIAMLAISGMGQMARGVNHIFHHIYRELDFGGSHQHGWGGGGWSH